MGVFNHYFCITKFLEILRYCDLVNWILKIDKEIDLVLRALAMLRVFLVPVFVPGNGVVFKAGGNLRGPEAFAVTNFFMIGLCATDSQQSSFLTHVNEGTNISYLKPLGHMYFHYVAIRLGDGCYQHCSQDATAEECFELPKWHNKPLMEHCDFRYQFTLSVKVLFRREVGHLLVV